jgi:D-alanyl-D-alanine carboxypeptidase/D-alanyl-D-alanine-endopeptidase (penicillin-binding protein 4)
MDTLYSRDLDPVLTRMMQESDNFLAEQLLIMSAWKYGFTDFQDFREFVIENWLGDIKPIWRDGSGLSRYNMIKPVDMVRLFNLLRKEYGTERLFPMLAQGGVSGTIEDWYANPDDPDEPYIFAKTGTLANNHILSGFLLTRSGKTLIFSLMNNHFVRPNAEVKKEMAVLLEEIRNAY